MAGNNRLGGQDFNRKLFTHLLNEIRHHQKRACPVESAEDLQTLRNLVEVAKLNLTLDVRLVSFFLEKCVF